jgi:Sec-independent protein translocase protein TatA
MKWLIILLVLLIVVALVAARYRRQIMTAWQLWRMFKKMRQMSQPTAEKRIETVSADKNESLVRCERCGNWVPQSEALKLRSKTVYCSTNCMERAVKLQSLVD